MDQTNTYPQPAFSRRLTLGSLGETLAAEYLEERGYRILARNWRGGRQGELDLIALDGDCAVAVEVKTRSGTGYGNPLAAITARKAARLRRLLLAWARQTHPGVERLRIDGVGITLRAGEDPRIDHLQGIG
ncbi:MAG: YraN family protein [Leucobacter sp.]